MTKLEITQDNFDSVRSEGIGNGFTVLNPADGIRKDNRLWFGTCSVCGESVTNSALTGKGWEHTVYLVNEPNHKVSKSVDYCPKMS